jgi:protein AaeX
MNALMKVLRSSLTILPALLLAGCAHSPTLDVLGSYFPAWMVCIVLGLVLTVITRQLLFGLKLNVHLRLAGVVYVCMTVLWTLAVWLLCFKN